MKKIVMIAINVVLALSVQAQSLLNGSFENGLENWDVSSLAVQSNDAFSLKAGSNYLEKWVSRGSAVGNAKLSQTVSQLPAGIYTLTVSAQNIQENTPTDKQTGAWIFADDEKTIVSETGDYSVSVPVITGQLTVGFEAVDATGNWLALDNFRLECTSTSTEELRAELLQLIEETECYTDSLMSETAMTRLKQVISDAQTVYDANVYDGIGEAATALVQAQKDAQEAIFQYKKDHATIDNLLDVTSWLSNPDFEDGFTGWVNSGMQIQSNNSFTQKNGDNYVEKWVSTGNFAGDGSISQTLVGLDPGIYILKTVGQNIQEKTPTVKQSGVYLFGAQSETAVQTVGEYTLQFTNIDSKFTLGLRAENATGNWVCVDNFSLYYAGWTMEALKSELLKRIDNAKSLSVEYMQKSCNEELLKAIATAEEVYQSDDTPERYTSVTDLLTETVTNANNSIEAYDALKTAISEAEQTYADGQGTGAESFRESIDEASNVYKLQETATDEVYAAIEKLNDAGLRFKVDNATGDVPVVVTDKRYARGCIEAFGRSTISGVADSEILERGFVYSETNPEPTIYDEKSTDYLEYNGRIYRMPMKPGTLYYIRAYAMTTGYAVGYGDVIRISTLPKGNVTWSYDYGSDDPAQNSRIETAVSEATNWWANYTSINGFNLEAHWSPGTPTADCGYGGYMRIGTNMGQRCGTVLHEMGHGIGTGTLEVWGGWVQSPLRQTINGDWCGDRANEAVRFWENNDDVWICGAYDGGHWGIHNYGQPYEDGGGSTALWMNKYAINGAHLEPGAWAGPTDSNGTQHLFIGNSIINQGFCEDGIIPVGAWSGGSYLPAYVFEHRDDVKYYLTSEDAEYGRMLSYLTEQSDGTLKWIATDGGIPTDDMSAWYISFDASKQYYQFRNAATGHYISYSLSGFNGFKAVDKVEPDDNENFHMLRRRAADAGEDLFRGYWMMNPVSRKCLTAYTSEGTGAMDQDLYDKASNQRWMILTADGADKLNSEVAEKYRGLLTELIANLRNILQTPYVEKTEGADSHSELTAQLDDVERRMNDETSSSILEQMYVTTYQSGIDYLGNVNPKDEAQPFDITFIIDNPSLKDNSKGWNGTPTHNYGCCEFYEMEFDFNQTITNMPKGYYKLTVQGFQRPGNASGAYSDFINNQNNVSTYVYIGTRKAQINHIAVDAQSQKLGGTESAVGSPVRYVPNDMKAASLYFDNDLYQNEVSFRQTIKDKDITMGLSCASSNNYYWTIFTNFHLFYYGSLSPTGVDDEVKMDVDTTEQPVYDLQGRRVVGDILRPGIYIRGGKKILVR